tara:strand:+ start:1682 stop:1843 length:162 start_codon:yes stop_codon:yes gene_type:complete
MAIKNFSTKTIANNYGTIPKGHPLKSNQGPQQIRSGKVVGTSPYPNGTSKGKK